MTFKVGDKIRGISDSFKITNKAMTLAEVMSVEPLGIRVKILEHTNKSQIGKICLAITLEEHLAHFELVEEKEMNKLKELEKQVELYEKIIESQQQSLETLKYKLEQLKAEREAKFRAEQLKVEAELRRFARPFVVGEDNYKFYFCHRTNSIFMGYYSYVQNGNIYFASKEIAQKAIDTVGEERIKKYYFGVNG